uniref:Xylulose kinase-1 n=1 Tax=Tanacetum cinerariifolium TaxID=118510 RepID=A0A6L2NI93_TANCI|nr:xylulose kinase-1 [Tanacetum cinerariifolium]
MVPLTFPDTHNIVAFLSKSDTSAGFDQIVDFLNTQVIQYALMVNPTIYVSCIKQFWATASIKRVNDVVKLQALIDKKKVVVTEDIIRQDLRLDDADGVECLSTEVIFAELNEFTCSMAPAVICLATGRKFNFSKYIFDSIVRNVDSPIKFHMIGKGFSGVETPLFATMLVQPQAAAEEEDEEDKSFVTLLHTLMETCATLSQKVAHLEQDKITQALEIIKLKHRVKKLKKKRRSKSSGLKILGKVDVDEDITLLDMETKVDLDAELQGRIKRKDDDNVAAKEVNATEPILFDDEEVTMTMAQTLIKMKAKKARILDEQMAKRLHDEEVEQAAAKEKQEQDDLKRT